MFTNIHLVLLAVSHLTLVSAAKLPIVDPTASTFVGATSSAVFPPPGATITATDTFFPDAEQVGFPGPTPTGDEAEAIATASVIAKVDSEFPLIQPDTSDHKGSSFDTIHHWGNLAPFASVDSKSFGLPDASPVIPEGCNIVQVHLVHRHGARYPTSGAAPASLAAKLHGVANSTGFSTSGPLSFLATWTYKLGAEILTPFGRSQLFDLGVGFRVKYGDLLKGFSDLPVFRTTSENRMVSSALHFAAGFFGVETYQSDYHQLITIEEDGFNNTLAPYDTCTNANNDIGNFGGVQQNIWAAVYLKDALERLSKDIKGVNLTISDVFAMQQTCAYETVALGFSAFCDLFTEEEWEGYEYANDLDFWYGNGPGNPTASAQGVGYVQELVSRLTQTRITEASTTLNTTIVFSNVTFPLVQPIFVDATHDVVISDIIVALNFTSFAANGPLPTDHIPKQRTYFVNQIAPFGLEPRQVLSCPTSDKPTHIRWILNDGVVPLTGIKGCKADKNGLCELSTFIDGIKARIAEIDYNFDCLANYTIPSPDTITTGQFPASLKSKSA